MNKSFLNIAAYKFVKLDFLAERRQRLLDFCQQRELKGTILLSPEGLNLFLAGTPNNVEQLVTHLRIEHEFADLDPKRSYSDHQPYNRMLVRIKKEIIAFSVDGVAPEKKTSSKISAIELKKWIDEGRDFTLLDVRNDYEVELGTFENAVPIRVDHFRDFPAATRKLPPTIQEKPIVMFCTGGIRCEKAGPFMENEGFRDVFQLDGGILKYFEQVGGKHYDGECFVFDKRVALAPDLNETETTQCYACQSPLSAADQASPKYVASVSCPYCYKPPAEKKAALIETRHAAIAKFCEPLPGSQPYDNIRPLNVPGKYDLVSLIEYLCGFFPQVSQEEWFSEIASRRILKQGSSCDPNQTVRGGERFEHVFPNTVEPPVNADIKIIWEDDAIIVVNKPAPLPMHASGRFNKNTLSFILGEIYKPQYLREIHRLDSITTGLVVLARTRKYASHLHSQFQNNSVSKTYFAQVHGHPESNAFECSIAIARQSSDGGVRRPGEDSNRDSSKPLSAKTKFTVEQRFGDETSLVVACPVTGRTNQIRIHLWHLGFPIKGDPVYLPARALGTAHEVLCDSPSLCLHSSSISFRHPLSNKPVTYSAPDPDWLVPRQH